MEEKSFNLLKPSVRIGKSGITDNLVDEIVKILKKKKVVKIKCLRYFLDAYSAEKNNNKGKMKEISDLITEKLNNKGTNCEITEIKGFTFIIKSKNE